MVRGLELSDIFDDVVSHNVAALRPRLAYVKRPAVSSLIAKVVQVIAFEKVFVAFAPDALMRCPRNLVVNYVHANALESYAWLVRPLPSCIPITRWSSARKHSAP